VSESTCSGELPLHEDAATVQLLISGMYDTNGDVTRSTVKPLLELARKYDVEDIRLNCERFLVAEPLSTSNLWHYMGVACTFDITSAIRRCQDYITTNDNFHEMNR
jgi:BTB/POZ domain